MRLTCRAADGRAQPEMTPSGPAAASLCRSAKVVDGGVGRRVEPEDRSDACDSALSLQCAISIHVEWRIFPEYVGGGAIYVASPCAVAASRQQAAAMRAATRRSRSGPCSRRPSRAPHWRDCWGRFPSRWRRHGCLVEALADDDASLCRRFIRSHFWRRRQRGRRASRLAAVPRAKSARTSPTARRRAPTARGVQRRELQRGQRSCTPSVDALQAIADGLAAVYLDHNLERIFAGRLTAKPSAEHKRELASMIHLCGAGAAKAFAQRGFRTRHGRALRRTRRRNLPHPRQSDGTRVPTPYRKSIRRRGLVP